MFTSHDVVFHETIFPYESISSISSNSVPMVPLSVSDSSPPELVSIVQQPIPLNPILPPQSPISPSREPILCRSQQPHHPPTTLRDYVCNQVTSPTICHLCHQV